MKARCLSCNEEMEISDRGIGIFCPFCRAGPVQTHDDAYDEYQRKWVKVARNTRPANRPRAEKLLYEVYKAAKHAPPRKIIWTESPIQCLRSAPPLKRALSRTVGVAPVWSWSDMSYERLRLMRLLSRSNSYEDLHQECVDVIEAVIGSISRAGLTGRFIRHPAERLFITGPQRASMLALYNFLEWHYKAKIFRGLQPYSLLAREAGWWIPLSKSAVLSEKPLALHILRGRLHRDGGPAIEYRDGWKIWALNGVVVPQEVAELPAEEIAPELIMKTPSVEVKREVLRKIGTERAVKVMEPQVLDRAVHTFKQAVLDAEGRHIGWREEKCQYELLSVRVRRVGFPARALKMTNPSTGTYHIEFVDRRCRTVEQALQDRNSRVSRFSSFSFPEQLT